MRTCFVAFFTILLKREMNRINTGRTIATASANCQFSGEHDGEHADESVNPSITIEAIPEEAKSSRVSMSVVRVLSSVPTWCLS